MSTINANIADYLKQIEALTQTNLQLLKTINESFSTSKNNLMVEVNETQYVVPSFVALENKINLLQENFDNLVNAPEYGEAAFNFNGNTRTIEVRKYNSAPPAIDLKEVNTYSVEDNTVFRDMLTPMPCIKFDVSSIADDIVDVNVKKLIPKSEKALKVFSNLLGTDVISKQHFYSQLIDSLSVESCIDNIDYIEYDTVYKLPIKKNTGSGEYIIKSVEDDYVNEYLENIIKIKIDGSLNYVINDDIEKPLSVGDELTTYDGTGKVIVTNVNTSNNILTVKVVNGSYLNLVGSDDYDTTEGISDYSKLRFYKPNGSEFEADKYVKVPFEDDQYVFVAVAPINSRMGVQSAWGTGLVISVHNLTNAGTDFKTYYNDNVKNIGNVLNDMSILFSNNVSALSYDTHKNLTEDFKPSTDSFNLRIEWINKHIENTDAVGKIRTEHNIKAEAEAKLINIDTEIDKLKSSIQSGGATANVLQLKNELQTKENEKLRQLEIINASIAAINNINASDVSIENAKYRLRGFIQPEKCGNDLAKEHVIGVRIKYRYTDLNGNNFESSYYNADDTTTKTYSGWIENRSYMFNKLAYNNGKYIQNFEVDSDLPDYTCIDIPITKGERVEVCYQLIYNYGQPFTNITSQWSEPKVYTFDNNTKVDSPGSSLTSIINQNTADFEKYKFTLVLNNEGITSHINDYVESGKTFLHKAENIDSGITSTGSTTNSDVKSVLNNLLSEINQLKNTVAGIDTETSINIFASNDVGGTINTCEIHTEADNYFYLTPYENIRMELTGNGQSTENSNPTNGYYTYDTNTGLVKTTIYINVHNTSEQPVKLYPLFRGNPGVLINNSIATYVDKTHYSYNDNGGVYVKCIAPISNSDVNDEASYKFLQTCNQFVTFRIDDPWDGSKYYTSNSTSFTHESQNILDLPKIVKNEDNSVNTEQMIVYPYVNTANDLCIKNGQKTLTINAGECVTIMLYCEFICKDATNTIEKTVSFDIRTSLFQEPKNYTLTIKAQNSIDATANTLLTGIRNNTTSNQPVNNTSILNKLAGLFR